MDSTLASFIGLALTMMGLGMELIRPILFRRQIATPEWLDTTLGFGGLALISGGVYLLWNAIGRYLIIRSPFSLTASPQLQVAASSWVNLLAFGTIVVCAMWAAVRLPSRLISQQSPAHFNLGFLVGQLTTNGLNLDVLQNLDITCKQLGLSYVRAKLSLIQDALEMDRFNFDEHGIMPDANVEKVFAREIADLHKVITKELEQIASRLLTKGFDYSVS